MHSIINKILLQKKNHVELLCNGFLNRNWLEAKLANKCLHTESSNITKHVHFTQNKTLLAAILITNFKIKNVFNQWLSIPCCDEVIIM